jgi:hypothetical protein
MIFVCELKLWRGLRGLLSNRIGWYMSLGCSKIAMLYKCIHNPFWRMDIYLKGSGKKFQSYQLQFLSILVNPHRFMIPWISSLVFVIPLKKFWFEKNIQKHIITRQPNLTKKCRSCNRLQLGKSIYNYIFLHMKWKIKCIQYFSCVQGFEFSLFICHF